MVGRGLSFTSFECHCIYHIFIFPFILPYFHTAYLDHPISPPKYGISSHWTVVYSYKYRILQLVFCPSWAESCQGQPPGINLSGRSEAQQMAGGNENQPVLEQQGESSKMTAVDSSSNNHSQTLTGQSGPMISGSSSPWPYAANADTTEPPEVVVNNAGWHGRPRVSPAGTLDPSDPQVWVHSGVLRSYRGWYLCAPIHF